MTDAPCLAQFSLPDAPEFARVDRPCKLLFTIDCVHNHAPLQEPFTLDARSLGARASSAAVFSRLKTKTGKPDPKSPAV